MKLLIVESPGKVKKIQGFLGSGWRAETRVGHVRDLPLYDMGVNPPNFRPSYAPIARGKSVLAMQASAVKNSDSVFLAMDPDREGEAIAWHLKDALRLVNPGRIIFSEITEKAVKMALEQPCALDRNLIAAKEGRRMLDRLGGLHGVRPPLSRHRLQKVGREGAKPGFAPDGKPTLSTYTCPVCEKPLAHRTKDGPGAYNFWGCYGFPNCKVTFQDDNGKPEEAE